MDELTVEVRMKCRDCEKVETINGIVGLVHYVTDRNGVNWASGICPDCVDSHPAHLEDDGARFVGSK